MIVTKRYLARRTLLRGLGATIALPLLDGMVPAFAAFRDTAANPIKRLSVVYVPNGIVMEQWTPATEGAGFELTPILEPLAPFRDRLLVLTGLDLQPAAALPGEGAGGHARAGGAFLTVEHPKKTEGSDIQAGISLDQLAAKALGQRTQLASLELSLDSTEFAGACDGGYSCAYVNTLSWRSATTPLPMENHPRAVFERLFGEGDSTDPAARQARLQKDRSILDSVTEEVVSLQRGLGARDRSKLTEYLEAVRDVERRIQNAEGQTAQELPSLERPAGIPSTYEEHAKLMFDLQVLAFQSDLTRVITFMMAREVSTRSYREIGVPDPHHPISHHQGDAQKIEKVVKINTFHTRLFEYFLERLQSTPDGDGSLLDHLTILRGSGMSNGDAHDHRSLPILLAGGGAGQLKGGRHVRYPQGTPLANLYLTVLEKLGFPMDRIGDSTGKIDYLSAV